MSTHSLSNVVYERLRIDIRSGNLEPGKPLRMEWLRATYGIGATPLREALSRLSAEHLVALQSGRGFRVAEVSAQEFEELVALRNDIEFKALKDALAKGDDEWEAGMVARYYSLSKMPWHVVNTDAAKLEEREFRHRSFHKAVISACGSRWAMRLWDQLSAHEERYRRIAMRGESWPPTVSKEVEEEHQEIMEAAIARDIERCWSTMKRHRRRTISAVRDRFADRSMPCPVGGGGPPGVIGADSD